MNIPIPAVTSKRLADAIPKFKKVLLQAQERDVNESDTVTIVTDIAVEVFGFDKYTEITREYAIQGTYCDIAIKSDKGIRFLIEVKAIGIDLKDDHIRQAVNYAAKEGIAWIVLTNGIIWQIYRVKVEGKVEAESLMNFNLLEINPRKQEDQEKLFLLCKRGMQKDQIERYYERMQAVNRYMVGALLLSDVVVNTVRRELLKVKTGVKVKPEEIENLLQHEVIKREVIDSEITKEAQKDIKKAAKKAAKKLAPARPAPPAVSDKPAEEPNAPTDAPDSTPDIPPHTT